jgi:hypothetical protein
MGSDSVAALVNLNRPIRHPEVNSFTDVLVRGRVMGLFVIEGVGVLRGVVP